MQRVLTHQLKTSLVLALHSTRQKELCAHSRSLRVTLRPGLSSHKVQLIHILTRGTTTSLLRRHLMHIRQNLQHTLPQAMAALLW